MGSERAPKQRQPVLNPPVPAKTERRRRTADVFSRDSLGNQALAKIFRLARTPSTAQDSLRINSPDDMYEQEAERMADLVMRMPETAEQSETAIAPSPTLLRKCRQCEDEEKLQRQAKGMATSPAPANVLEVLHRSGQCLDAPTREFFEPRFGQDFSSVRILDDPTAARSAEGVQAKAYTVGDKIVFNTGEYAPHTSAGRHLLAHELTHVVQQGRGQALVQRVAVPSTSSAPAATPDTLPPTPGSPAAPEGPTPPGQHDGQLAATWGWFWKTKLTAGKRAARDFDSFDAAKVFATSLGRPAAVFQEEKKYIIYPIIYTALHSFTYDNAKINREGADCDLRAAAGVLAIMTEDGVAILPHQMKGDDGQAKPDYGSPMEAQAGGAPAADPFAARKDVFGAGMGSITERDPFLNQFHLSMRDVALAALDKSQRQAEDKQKETASGALPIKDAAVIRKTAQQLVEIDDKLFEARLPIVGRPVSAEGARQLTQARAVQRARIAELQRQRDIILLDYPLLSRIDAKAFLQKSENEQAQALGSEAGDVLEKIKTTRDNIMTGSLELWAIPPLVRATQAGLGVTDDGRKKWIEEKVRQTQEKSDALQQAISVFQIAFSIAAVLIGGPAGVAFAAGALAVSVGEAVAVTEKFAEAQAAAGTDIDPKKALVPADLTGQWLSLALAWVNVGLTLADAAYWVRNVKSGTITVDEAAAALAKSKNIDETALKAAAKDVAKETSTAVKGVAARMGLAPEEFEAELAAIRRGTVYELPAGEYDLEIVGKNHTWRRRLDGRWCMFSNERCYTREILEEFAEFAEISRAHVADETRLRTFTPTTPTGVGTTIQLNANVPLGGDATGRRLLKHVEDAIAKFEVEGFTPRQLEALNSPVLKPGQRKALEAAYRGERIDEFAKAAVMDDAELAQVISTPKFSYGADFYDGASEKWYDITTTRAWKEHVKQYGPAGFQLPTELAPAPK